MQVIKQLKDISKNYNVLFCDIWGCIHNGKEAYQNALKALVEFKRNNGFVMLLTNAPRPKNEVNYLFSLLDNFLSNKIKELNKEKYLSIGESDRMTLRFVKPKN